MLRRRNRLEHDMKSLFSRFIKNQSGATIIEYGLIAALLAVVCITTLQTASSKLNDEATPVSSGLK
jgi:pilus assembly protein Flp/PilA